MSYILKSAAMSLLSKTLQTFLYKYLEDVDVEGINLPSVYDGSWGLRLSNVKLRKGVQLVKQLKGGRKRKRPCKERERSFDEGAESDGEASIQMQEVQESQPTSNSLSSTTQEDNTIPHHSSKALDMSASSHDYTDESDQDHSMTPDQKASTGRTFFTNCFSSSRSNVVTTQPPNATTTSSTDTETTLPAALPLDNGAKGPLSPVQEDSSNKNETNRDEMDKECDDEEEEEEFNQPMQLCIGEDGRIGTLDIRYENAQRSFFLSLFASVVHPLTFPHFPY